MAMGGIVKGMGVYAIRNTLNDRVYVGSSKRLANRWSWHRSRLKKGSHTVKGLQLLYFEHGIKVFSFDILEVVESPSDLIRREQFWIDELAATLPTKGFNLHPTAGSSAGYKVALDVRAKMSASRKGRKLAPRSEAHKEAIRRYRIGKTASDEARAKMSEDRKGRVMAPFSDAHKAAISRARSGIKASDEARAKMSASRKGRKMPPRSEAHKAAIKTSRMGTKHSEDAKAKMSASHKGLPLSPEHKEKLRARIIILNKSPEAKARIAERNRRKTYPTHHPHWT